jgi:tellurium resistance protein TerD
MQLEISKQEQVPFLLTTDKVQKFFVELYWKSEHDLDAAAFALGKRNLDGKFSRLLSTLNSQDNVYQDEPNKKIIRGTDRPFMNSEGYLLHQGDIREGDATGDAPSEVIEIDLEKVPSDIDKVLFNISIFEPSNATFDEVYDTFVVIKDDSGKQYFKAHLTSDFNSYNAVNVGRIERNHDGWSFVATGEGFKNGINGVLGKYSK